MVLVLLAVLIAATGCWGALALFYTGPHVDVLRYVLPAAFAAASLATLLALGVHRWRWASPAGYAALLAALLLRGSSIEPSNDRDWQADVAALPYATIDGDRCAMHNIRNFDHRSQSDYPPAYYDRRFDLRDLGAADLVAVHGMGRAIAHIFVGLAFANGDHLAISIETRKENGEGDSARRGFFRQ